MDYGRISGITQREVMSAGPRTGGTRYGRQSQRSRAHPERGTADKCVARVRLFSRGSHASERRVRTVRTVALDLQAETEPGVTRAVRILVGERHLEVDAAY